MKIYKMTATFGKLDHATLELEPGLNIIKAPNEWGKSTWCAFLVAMLYGLDTRAKTTKTALADKERYAPWSGAPMAGRIDLNWNGRDITIERRTKRRVPLGEFQAYETTSGLPVAELTAANCGQMLLGVEQTVFRRAGFIRHGDLPVTQDEALRRRLNDLVTTGDDSGAADRLTSQLRDLKNRCRYNRSGLLPQMEAQQADLENKITELDSLTIQTQKLHTQLEDLKQMLEELYNHRQALAYAKMEADIARMAQTRQQLEQAEALLAEREAACEAIPPREEAERKVRELRFFRDEWNDIQAEVRQAPPEPVKPQMNSPYTGMTAEAAREMARQDAKAYTAVAGTKLPLVLLLVGLFGTVAAAGLIWMKAYAFAAVAGAAALLAFFWGGYEKVSVRRQTRELLEKYGDPNWKHWLAPIVEYEAQMQHYSAALKEYQEVTSDLEVRLMVLRNKRELLCGIQEPDPVLALWQDHLAKWEACQQASRDVTQLRQHMDTLNAIVKPVEKPTQPDSLAHSEVETSRLVTECALEQQRLHNRLGQYQGRMEVLGSREALEQQLSSVRERILKLENTYMALTIAQETLAAARAELQRRFAPRITQQAQKYMTAMTAGRYHSVTMSEDLSLQAGAGEEETVHDAIWRSDGTMDQLYLSLRLAVAEELTPEAPLVLDDALVRFDDIRMKAAVEILKEMAERKQVILFTCQGRESDL